MYVLDKLWRGKLSPNEQCCHYGSEYSNLRDRWLHIGKLISAELTEEGKKRFQEYQDLLERLSAISEEDSFVNGFRYLFMFGSNGRIKIRHTFNT